MDTALPFGIRSAPIIFTALADALEWVVKSEGVTSILHYLDDYLLVDKTEKCCQEALKTLLRVYGELRVPVAPEKLEGPLPRLTFLGIELDTESLTVRLAAGKLAEL